MTRKESVTFRAKLKQLMDDTGCSIKAISRWCGTAPGTVTRWLNGYSQPAPQMQEVFLKDFPKEYERAQQLRKFIEEELGFKDGRVVPMDLMIRNEIVSVEPLKPSSPRLWEKLLEEDEEDHEA